MLLLLLAVNYFVGSYLAPDAPARLEVPYTFFRQQVDAGNVAEITSRGDVIQGTFKQAVTYPPEGDQTPHEPRRSAPCGRSSLIPASRRCSQQGVVINARPIEEPRAGG